MRNPWSVPSRVLPTAFVGASRPAVEIGYWPHDGMDCSTSRVPPRAFGWSHIELVERPDIFPSFKCAARSTWHLSETGS